MAQDMRPANCRFRLRDEGKVYPKSSCQSCGRSIITGLSNACIVATPGGPTPVPLGADEIPEGRDTETPEQIAARVRRETLIEAAFAAQDVANKMFLASDKAASERRDELASDFAIRQSAAEHVRNRIRALIDKEPRT